MRLLIIFIALAISNYAYQAFSGHQWHVALERTWFQGLAMMCVYLIQRFVWQ
jgi:hypothetical protein